MAQDVIVVQENSAAHFCSCPKCGSADTTGCLEVLSWLTPVFGGGAATMQVCKHQCGACGQEFWK